MNKKHFVLTACLAVLLTSCLFDSDENGLSTWLADQGLPDNYKVQVAEVNGLLPKKAELHIDSLPIIQNSRIVFGQSSGLNHKMAMEFAYVSDTSFLRLLGESDSVAAYVSFRMLTPFYKEDSLPVKQLPIKEKLDVTVSWKLGKGLKRSYADSVAKVSDSVWVAGLKDWTPDVTFDTTYSLNVKKADTLVYFDMPKSFIDSIKTCRNACHLEMTFSAPESKNLYRFYALDKKKYPIMRLSASIGNDSSAFKGIPPFRMAEVIENNDCSDCLVLHAGYKDSLVVEYPVDPILNALSEFYGDEFPYTVGDGFDVRQAVVMAQLNFARDDADGENHLGLPIKVVVGSYVDSVGKEVREFESYKVDKKYVVKNGHPDIVFYDGDSLSLQVTYGVRDLLNRAKDKESFKIMMHLYLPELQYKDSTYATYLDKNKDTNYVFLGHYDYARYDFSNMMKKPARLKLWLATKRGDAVSTRGDE